MSEVSDHYEVGLAEEDGETVVVVKGEIDLYAARSLWASIEQAIGDGTNRLVLDMAGTTFIDSSGLEVLLRAHRALGRVPEAVIVRAPSVAVCRVITLAGLESCFSIIS